MMQISSCYKSRKRKKSLKCKNFVKINPFLLFLAWNNSKKKITWGNIPKKLFSNLDI